CSIIVTSPISQSLKPEPEEKRLWICCISDKNTYIPPILKHLSVDMKEYYIQLFSPHGLIRYKNPEIGRDKDTGGQVKYVLELLEALSQHPQVRKVDLFTRRISDRRVSTSYSQPIEIVNEKARIIRIECGGSTYKEKEQLWDHLDEFINNTIRFNEEEDDFPDILHG